MKTRDEKEISADALISFLSKTKNGEYAKVYPITQTRIENYGNDDEYFYSMS